MESQSQYKCQSLSQRVMLIHDASTEVSMDAIRWILDGFSLKHGDIFTLLSVFNQDNKRGFRIKTDDFVLKENQKAIDDEFTRKKEEYRNNLGLVQILKLFEMHKVLFKIEFGAGLTPKNVALEAAKKSIVTWVILDRRMRRDRKYFLDKLTCGVSRMKSNNNIVKIRDPKILVDKKPKAYGLSQISYSETLPGPNDDTTLSTKALNDEDMFSIEVNSSCRRSTRTSMRTSVSAAMLVPISDNPEEKIKKAIKELSMLLEAYTEENHHKVSPKKSKSHQVQMPFVNLKICSFCSSTRPTSAWQIRNFPYLELIDATNIFSSKNLIRKISDNETMFHGTLKNSNLDVVVKELKDVKKYKSEMQVLEKISHENVIKLLGTCLENCSRLLILEYACNGSLDHHLSNQNIAILTWEDRLNIAIGASKGLYHLHENDIIHCDVCPNNIFLTHHFDPLIAGFGLARTAENKSQNSLDHLKIGTFGYMAPEYTEQGEITKKTDVYAFGVVLLELITCRSILDTRSKGQSLLKWARTLIKGRKFFELMDPTISYDNHRFMETVQVTINCLSKDPNTRLSMKEVVSKLEYIKDGKSIHEAHQFDQSFKENV